MSSAPQISMAIALAGNTIAAIWAWVHSWRKFGAMIPFLDHWQQLVVRFGWIIALLPLSEAWLLQQGGFWHG